MYKGKLNEVLQLSKNENLIGPPTYWWPEDESWCIFAGVDFEFAVIGGRQSLIDQFTNQHNMECIEVDQDTRLDMKADVENLK